MTSVAKDYSAALFMLAAEEGREDDFANDIKLVQKMFAENPDYIQLLYSPVLSHTQKEDIINEAFGESVAEQVVCFLGLLCRRGHIHCIDQCAEEFDKLYKASKQISAAKVISAAKLSEDQLTRLQLKLEKLVGHRVEIESETDETIMGGITVYIDGKLLDGSLKRKLNDMKEVMAK